MESFTGFLKDSVRIFEESVLYTVRYLLTGMKDML